MSSILCLVFLCLFKQKTAYEMRISDWSSDVCSSDLNWRGSSNRKLRPPISGRFVTDEFAAKIEDPNICRPLERKNSQSDTVHVFAWKSSMEEERHPFSVRRYGEQLSAAVWQRRRPNIT